MLSSNDWRTARSEVTPAFSTSRIKAMYPLIEDVCYKMTKYLEQNENTPIEVKEMTAKYTTDVVASCIFSTDAQSFSNGEVSVIRKMGKEMTNQGFSTFLYIILSHLCPWIRKIWKFKFMKQEVTEFFTKLMENSVKYREENKVQRVDYLDHLISLHRKKDISIHDMASHGITFFLDGFETSSVGLSFVLYELAANKKEQDKLRKEILENTDENGEISFEKLVEMQHLDNCLNESLRLWPPAALIVKKCTESIIIPINETKNIKIEKGIDLIIPVWSFQRDENVFDDPNTFRPDRFKCGVKKYQDEGAFLAFGDGPRKCIGMRFATANLKRAIVEIVRNFIITVDSRTMEPIQLDPKDFLITIAKGGLWLNFKKI